MVTRVRAATVAATVAGATALGVSGLPAPLAGFLAFGWSIGCWAVDAAWHERQAREAVATRAHVEQLRRIAEQHQVEAEAFNTDMLRLAVAPGQGVVWCRCGARLEHGQPCPFGCAKAGA